MLKKIGLILLVLVIALVVGGLVMSPAYAVERSIEIERSPAEIHALIGNLERWDEWTPFKDNDPTVAVTLGDKTEGVGASQTWDSEEGKGSMTFTKSDPATGVAYDMTMEGFDPSSSEIRYERLGENKTKVTWTMDGEIGTPVLGPYFAILVKQMVPDLYDQGLNKLKTTVEQKK